MSDISDEMDDSEFEGQVKQAGELLEKECRDLGIYLESVMLPPVPEGMEGKKVVVVDFIIGDRAWSDRVQNPRRYAEDETTKEMIADAGLDDPVPGLMEEWSGLLGKGGDSGGDSDRGVPKEDDRGSYEEDGKPETGV